MSDLVGRASEDEPRNTATAVPTSPNSHVAAELELLRVLREHKLGVQVENDEGSLNVRPVEK